MVFYEIATRAQALAMKAMGATLNQIENITKIKRRSLQYLIKKALNRGWNPTTNPLIIDGYVIDAPHPGKKTKCTREFEQQILKKVTSNRYSREKSCAYITAEYGYSTQTIWRVLRRHGYRKTKPTRKPGLTPAIKEARYQFALRYRNWTIEDWKAVIWSDETGVVLGHRRGGYKLWRLAKEKVNSLFDLAGRGPPSLCSGAASHTIGRDLAISGRRRLKRKRRRQKRTFRKSTTQSSQSFVRRGRLLLA